MNVKDLPALTPDPNRTERVRARCHAQLARSQRREAHFAVMTGVAWRVLGPSVLGVFCVIYTAALIATAHRLQALLW